MEPMLLDIGGQKIKVPSKLYPLASTKNSILFAAVNTEPITDPRIAALLDRYKYEAGYCYSNADQVASVLRENGYEAEFYAGWVFIGNERPPLHHAWVMLGTKHLIDVSVNSQVDALMQEVDYSDEDWRAKVAPKVKQVQANSRTSVTCAFGQPFDYMAYAGCKDTPDHARNVFNHTIRKYPDHPSYKDKLNPRGASELQTEIWK